MPNALKTYLLLLLMVIGAVTTIYVFANNRQSLPVNVGLPDSDTSGETLIFPVVPLETNSTEAASNATENNLALTDFESTTYGLGTPLTFTDIHDSIVQIPVADSKVTILVAGTAGCNSCGYEAQSLSGVLSRYKTDEVRGIFVDIGSTSDPESLTWFAEVLSAPNLIWVMDTEGAFSENYAVSIESTVIMNSTGHILYRDDSVTSYETFIAQIDRIIPIDSAISSDTEIVLNNVNESRIQIPDQDRALTILLAGTVGCATCGTEAQTLSRILDEYGDERLRVIFVDIYNIGGTEPLAQFASQLGATNLTWTIDTDKTFMRTYKVDLDSTVIMDQAGNILFRDNIITSFETFQEQIEVALAQ